MKSFPYLDIQGIPQNIPEEDYKLFSSRLLSAFNKLLDQTKLSSLSLSIKLSTEPLPQRNFEEVSSENRNSLSTEDSVEKRALQYKSSSPLFGFDQLKVPEEVLEDLYLAIDLAHLEKKIFDDWGLRKIEPFPRTALNFYGEPGTGKTLAAHAIASKLERPILVASYADIESSYHGEGPKNVEAIFYAAERDNAVIFIDEADSMLSKRLTKVTQGAEQTINSMRSQLLISLERFSGISIFATNLISNYDRAFETRVQNIFFPMPDKETRLRIWQSITPRELPLAEDVSFEELSNIEGLCGRDIKNAVIDAAKRAARKHKDVITFSDLLISVNRIKQSKIHQQSKIEEVELEM